MSVRAAPSGITLTRADAALVKGMLARGDRQHDIAAYFGVNGGRIAEIATGHRFAGIAAAPASDLPPRGPYPCGRDAIAALLAIEAAKAAVTEAERIVKQYAQH
jgi:hypothetical protein